MQILIVDQCSKAKKGDDRYEPVDPETIATTPRTDLISQDDIPAVPATDLYEGRQQQRITEAVNRFEEAGDAVDRIFISAGFGVIDSTDRLPPYNITFADMTSTEVDDRATQLGIYEDLRRCLDTGTYDLVFFALGSDYYRSARIEDLIEATTDAPSIVVFNREELAAEYDHVVSISARTDDAKDHGTIVIALKGQYLKNFAAHRETGKTPTETGDVKRYCTEDPYQSGLSDY
ncbi:hypothetical protein QA600_18565 [Natronococcus sp. A-GB1]|uniref:hypothetical protein n=1 Tax=Natronococcus sp. A-GB1 TaxID=3037648 RepID=UPI00241D26E1|nr:hypothetical protein [Natronococcus sp. A-GB1]MDG5761337.1 hypothetical protein [Natronococcus sp. A-GB1]